MLKQLWPYSMLLILVFGLGSFFAITQHRPKDLTTNEIALNVEEIFAPQLKKHPDIVLVDPEMAPPEIRDEVMKGYRILIDTQKQAKEYAGDRLNCRNCHFQAGNTLGGKNGSISLVGVTYVYPRYSQRAGRDVSLVERINACFERSLNGKPLPVDGPKMKAILAYLNWISAPVKDRKEFPWLGLPKMTHDYKPNPDNGKKLYALHCAACHLDNGQGTKLPMEEQVLDIPPLWGDDSFNDGSGMSHIDKMAPFIWLNMPFMTPVLNEKESMDVGQYIINQPRPKFER
ncbi:MAG: Thiosulfate dehydrogenase [Chlamydiae bacterium]|nr:Thiosulfate dehydrogenase [Chlamydiota bacterium]